LAKLTPIQNNIHIPYIGRYLKSKYQVLHDNCTGATIPHISKNFLNNLKIPLPPLSTQKKIAAILDKAQALIDNDKKVLEKYDQLAQSVFLEMFGDPYLNPHNWKIHKVEELAADEKHAIKAGPFGSSLKKEFYTSKGYKIYGQEQVIRDDLTFGDYYISKDRFNKLKNNQIKAGDVLISLVGTYGLISIVPEDYEPGIINPRLMKITLDKNYIIPQFFKSLLFTEGIKAKIKNMTHGGTMNIVNVGIMKNLEIPVPPIELQKEYIMILDKIKRQNQNSELSLQKSEELFNSLLQKAFKGELVE
jgi:type I restriction enzyme S subunit